MLKIFTLFANVHFFIIEHKKVTVFSRQSRCFCCKPPLAPLSRQALPPSTDDGSHRYMKYIKSLSTPCRKPRRNI